MMKKLKPVMGSSFVEKCLITGFSVLLVARLCDIPTFGLTNGLE